MFQIAFFTENYGASYRYRVNNISDAFLANGFSTNILPFNEFFDFVSCLDKTTLLKTIVLHRCAYPIDDRAEKAFEKIKSLNIKLVFDADDYVFEPEIIEGIWGYHQLNEEDKKLYISGVHRYRKMLKKCDLFVAPTRFLCEKAEELGVKSFVIPNTFNTQQLKRSLYVKDQKISNGEKIEILYMSGSNTHGADFKECEEALLQIMQKYANVNFVIYGYLKLDEKWSSLSERIQKYDVVDHEELQEAISNYDLNIAPLVVGDPFCEGKSPLKYFESALCDMPTIASNTSSYQAVIKNGDNGLLATTKEDWYNCFEELILSKSRRDEVGKNAFNHVITSLGVYNIKKETLIKAYCLDAKINQLWIIPGIIVGGGGHRNIFRNIYQLEKSGNMVDILLLNSDHINPASLRNTIRNHFYKINSEVYTSLDSVKNIQYDQVFVTHWTTVQYAFEMNFIDKKNIIYFVQDLEYMFYEVSTNYLLAENTYKKGLYAITSGLLPSKVLFEKYGMECDYFTFPIDNKVYFNKKSIKRKKDTVIFFCKPEMPRRCFELGLQAIKHIQKERDDIKFILFGSNNVTDAHIEGLWLENYALLPTIKDLADLYRESTIGMVFSTTNPSLVPYEMMACGLPVIDLKTDYSRYNYGNSENIAFLSEPEIKEIAKSITTLIDYPDILKKHSKNGLDFVKTFPNEKDMAKTVNKFIMKKFKENI